MNKELKTLASSTTYITPSRYISGRIVEYDIKSANINMLLKYNKIGIDQYNYLSSLPKRNREIEVGLIIRSDHSYYDAISNGIIKAKEQLFESNNISPESIVRIANDAVYINSLIDLKYTQFDNIIFNKKSISNVLLKLGRVLFFFSYHGDDINIDIKGLGKENQYYHQNYIITFIANIIYLIERVSPQDALKEINNFYEEYINLNLPIEYYREFNENSLYRIKYSNFLVSETPKDISNIDINCNLYILRELWSIVLEKCNIK